jgi:hypothetical protein
MSNAMLKIAVEFNIEIVFKYLEVGHTFLECDSVHSCIERKLKNTNIYLPSDYVKIAQEARHTPFRYEAELLNYKFFSDFTLAKGQFYPSIRPNKPPGKDVYYPKVNDIVALKLNSSGIIQYKLNHNDEWVDLKSKPKPVLTNLKYPKMYKGIIKIDDNKFKHLQEIKKTLPAYVHDYYDSLPHEEKEKKKSKKK